MAILPVYALAAQCDVCGARGPICGDDFPLAQKLAVEAGFRVVVGKNPNPPIESSVLVSKEEDGGETREVIDEVHPEVEAARAIMCAKANRHLCPDCQKSLA